MAPIGEKSAVDSVSGEKTDEEEGQNLWAVILSEVQSSSTSKLPACKSVLVLGDGESGKTTLVAKLQGNEDPKKGSGLEYHYIEVKDDYRDDQARLGVWTLDGDPHHTGLLRFALNEENFEHTMVIISVSMTQPWLMMESLQKWTTLLRDHIDRLKIPRDKMREFEESLVRHFQEYVEPEEGQEIKSPPRRDFNPLHPSASSTDEERVLLPLGESTLTNNLGIPIVVVVTKSDAISTLEKENDYREEHFDFIQQHIRKFCLNYGAALAYVSVKEDKNCELLYKYLVHRIYGFPFSVPGYVVERDSVFVPAGWDNEKKISILYENMRSMKPEDSFEDVIAKPVTRKPIMRDADIVAEDEQLFLMKQQTQLDKAPPAGGESPARPASRQPASPRPAGGSPNTTGSPKKIDGPKANAASEGVLANFFNSLLNKKTGAASPKAEKSSVSRDAAAELDRMTRAKKPSTGSPASSGGS
ncbi:cytoplasmic dynein 1 light intermediate chain 2 isoform X1 [Lingula anatina]|uniref:Dynein light intermediate chain n=1 Tax=Lingula anatina TaxID=7574 RepID=A0A1S3KB13_LINAN|nr:cytoplasmic dynein 1 light intermediate chain 2 isoform X1 [Lingula anatina]|eukprot:XP_013419825.1 cytoplasmic dynein 1 light intermediate chain 2 isoform X1 [Lingula anatina]